MSKDNVINLNAITTLDLQPDRVLTEAIGKLDSAMVIGYDKEGFFYFASTKADGGDVLWLLEVAKKLLLEAAED